VTDTLAYLKGENWDTIKKACIALAFASGEMKSELEV
jgi:hypothetical protein